MPLHTNVAVHLHRRNSSEYPGPDLNEHTDVLKDLAKTQQGLADLGTLLTPFSNSYASGLITAKDSGD